MFLLRRWLRRKDSAAPWQCYFLDSCWKVSDKFQTPAKGNNLKVSKPKSINASRLKGSLTAVCFFTETKCSSPAPWTKMSFMRLLHPGVIISNRPVQTHWKSLVFWLLPHLVANLGVFPLLSCRCPTSTCTTACWCWPTPSTGNWRTGSGTAWRVSTASGSRPSRGTEAGPCWRPSRR